MNSRIPTSNSITCFINDVMLLEMYHIARSIVSRYVYRTNIAAWRGQELDVINDIVQDVVIRIIAYVERVELPIRSLAAISRTIARNYCHDLWRIQTRRTILHHDERMPIHDMEQISGFALQKDTCLHVQDDSLIKDIVDTIATFPAKQRTALLIEIAHHLDDLDEATEIQQIFLAADIDILAYQESILISKKERSRHTALLSLARKRLREAPNLRLQELHLIKQQNYR